MGTLGSQVMCDNIPGLVNKQRQLCRQHPKVMQAIGAGMKDWISECQHQFRNHRWNCNTMARDNNLFGRLLIRSEWKGTVKARRSTLSLIYNPAIVLPAVVSLSKSRSRSQLRGCSWLVDL